MSLSVSCPVSCAVSYLVSCPRSWSLFCLISCSISVFVCLSSAISPLSCFMFSHLFEYVFPCVPLFSLLHVLPCFWPYVLPISLSKFFHVPSSTPVPCPSQCPAPCPTQCPALWSGSCNEPCPVLCPAPCLALSHRHIPPQVLSSFLDHFPDPCFDSCSVPDLFIY